MSKGFSFVFVAMLVGLLAGCGGAPTGQVELPQVFNTGGQVLIEGWSGDTWGNVVGTSNQALLRLTVATRRTTENVTVDVTETVGHINATVTGDNVATAAGQVLIANDRWLLWPGMVVLGNVQARSRGDYIDVSKNGAVFRLGTIETGRQVMLTLQLPVSVYE